jgi:hypothetical protein
MRFSLAGGVAFQLGPVYLPQMQAAGLLGGLQWSGGLKDVERAIDRY